MKVAFLSESPADEAALVFFIEGLLGAAVERVSLPAPSTRGCNGVLKAALPTLRHLHYCTDAEALVVSLDSDESPVHSGSRGQAEACHRKCRLCQLWKAMESAQEGLPPRQGRGPIKIALGLAVPAVEAWCLRDARINESAWMQSLESHKFAYTKKELKQRLYGCPAPILALETARLVEHARRIVAEDKLELLEKLFPIGFGSLADEVRSWRS